MYHVTTSHPIDSSVFDQLQGLSMYYRDEARKGSKIKSWYERVQYTPKILPRLYLLITIGAQIIKSKENGAKEVLKDLIEMCKGVQHPTRGLFLRNYLLQSLRDKLPDKDNDFGGTFQDSIDFILLNLKEMVNLWVRLKKDQEKEREKERLDLSDIIGGNLNRLSKLEGLDFQANGLSVYQSTVLPKILEIIVESKDAMAQQYLMDCVIQAFPDEYHIETLETLCSTTLKLVKSVNFKIIYTSLMNRLTAFVGRNPKFVSKVNFVDILTKYVMLVIEKGIPVADSLAIQASLIGLSLKCHPKNVEFVATILGGCSNLTEKGDFAAVIELLKVPLISPLMIFEIEKYIEIYNFLDWNEKKVIAKEILKSLLKQRLRVSVAKHVARLFELIAPLVRDVDEKSETQAVDDKFEEEQTLVARALHLIYHPDTESHFKLLGYARKTFGQGGLIRIQYTLPSLVIAYLELGKVSDNEKIFSYIVEILKVLSQHYPRVAYPIYLEAALAADNQKNMKTVSATLQEAFLLYEAEDAKNQPDALRLLVNVLMKLQNLKPESYDRLASKLCQYAAKLARKSDQCRSGLLCSQLFWCDSYRNGEKGVECLSWALQIVKQCMPIEQIPLLIDVLNCYIYHFETKNSVKVEAINSLLNLIKTNILELEDEDPEKTGTSVRNYYLNTLGYLKLRKASAEEYKDIKL